jgi:8-oxo-dGTP pyrophosphatase MutT (NUDIX family)
LILRDAADDDETPATQDEETAGVFPRHAASLIVLRLARGGPETLMGTRGPLHKFMPNRLVFPGGAVDPEDIHAAVATPLRPDTRAHLEKAADPGLAHGLGVAAARELEEESGLTMGVPALLDGLEFLCRMVTPPNVPMRFNARFLVIDADRVSGSIAGSGELEALRYYPIEEALALDLAQPTRHVLQRLGPWLAMSAEERLARHRTPVYDRRTWSLE